MATNTAKLLGLSEIADALGITQSHANDLAKNEGLPHTMGAGARGRTTRLFDLEECRRWMETHRSNAATPQRRTKDDIEAEQRDVRGLIDRADAEEIRGRVQNGLLTKAGIDLLKGGLEAESKAIDLAKQRGDLVAVRDVREKLREALSAVGAKIDSLPARLAHAVVSALGVPPEREALARQVMEREIGGLLAELENMEV